jgi:Holliday junction resolvasome RuvABC endonuclease subunit
MVSLDLSLSSTGWAVFENKKLIHSGSIQPYPKLSNYQKLYHIVDNLEGLIRGKEQVVIEDTFSGRNPKTFKELNRLAGAVIYLTVRKCDKEPIFYEASIARKAIGINPSTTKFDSQIWVLQQFFPKIDVKSYIEMSDVVRRQYVSRKITKTQYEYQLNEKLTKIVGKETNHTNDETDAIIVGLAHLTKEK